MTSFKQLPTTAHASPAAKAAARRHRLFQVLALTSALLCLALLFMFPCNVNTVTDDTAFPRARTASRRTLRVDPALLKTNRRFRESRLPDHSIPMGDSVTSVSKTHHQSPEILRLHATTAYALPVTGQQVGAVPPHSGTGTSSGNSLSNVVKGGEPSGASRQKVVFTFTTAHAGTMFLQHALSCGSDLLAEHEAAPSVLDFPDVLVRGLTDTYDSRSEQKVPVVLGTLEGLKGRTYSDVNHMFAKSGADVVMDALASRQDKYVKRDAHFAG